MTGEFGRALRRHWLLDNSITFLNHGSFGATPRPVLDVQESWRQRLERQPVAFMNQTLPPALREAAATLAAFLGADADGLVFATNTTEAVNGVVRSLDLRAGDDVLTTSFAYPAVRNILGHVCARAGARLIEAPLPFPVPDADAILAALDAALTPRTRLAVIDHVASHQAVVMPLDRMIALCHDRSVPVLVDGAHGPGLLPLDLAALGADWYAGNCHKWLYAPKGAAVLWASPARRAETRPAVISNQYGQGFAAEFDWTGTRDPSAWLSAPAGLAFLHDLGIDDARAYMTSLAHEAGTMLAEAWGTETGAPPAMMAAMATVRVPGTGDDDAARRLHDRLLAEHGIEVPVFAIGGALWLRISAQVYNQRDDYEVLAAAVTK